MKEFFLLFGFLLGCILLFLLFKKLTPGGRLAALFVAVALSSGGSYVGIILISCFFVLGVAATAFGRKRKERKGYAEPRGGQRNAGQVLANGGAAAILGLMAWYFPTMRQLTELLIACAASSATADTISSEVGVVLGNRTYNILSFRKDKKGENGVVSMEGTLAGLAGSGIIATVFVLLTSWNLQAVLIIITAGTVGNLADSVLGATIEKRKWIGNNTVNFFNTVIAAAAGYVLHLLF